MEGRREEYLANRIPKPIAHVAEVEDNQTDVEENHCIVEEHTLSNEFAAMSLGTPNDIHYTTYALSSFPEISTDLPFALSSISQDIIPLSIWHVQIIFSEIEKYSTPTISMVQRL